MTIIVSTTNSIVTSPNTVIDEEGNVIPSLEQCMMTLIHSHNIINETVAYLNNMTEIKKIIEDGVDIHYSNDYFLWYSCYTGKFDLIKFFIQIGLKINGYDNQPLRMAVKGNCNIEIIQYLVCRGADVSCCANDPIRNAARRGNLTMLKYFLANGAGLDSNNWEVFRWGKLSENKETIDYLNSLQKGIKDEGMTFDMIQKKAKEELITEFGENFFCELNNGSINYQGNDNEERSDSDNIVYETAV